MYVCWCKPRWWSLISVKACRSLPSVVWQSVNMKVRRPRCGASRPLIAVKPPRCRAVGYLNVWLRVAFPIAVRRLTFCSLDWPQQRFKQRFFSHKIEMKSNADTKYYPTHRDEVTCFGLLLICTSSPPSSQEREPLRAIPLKEIHKVQECKQRSVSLPVSSVFGLIQGKFTKTSPLCPPASTWWGTTCSRWSPAQEPSTYR